MTSTKYPQVTTATHTPRYALHTIVRYNADADWYRPAPERPWASLIEHVECTHQHRTMTQAEECGQRLAKRAAAAYQAQCEATYPHTPCDVHVAVESDIYRGETDTGHGYALYCAGHHTTSAGTWQRTVADAEALDWACPWLAHLTANAAAMSTDATL